MAPMETYCQCAEARLIRLNIQIPGFLYSRPNNSIREKLLRKTSLSYNNPYINFVIHKIQIYVFKYKFLHKYKSVYQYADSCRYNFLKWFSKIICKLILKMTVLELAKWDFLYYQLPFVMKSLFLVPLRCVL